MSTEQASLTAQSRYKQILSELAELYERREKLKREQAAQAPTAKENGPVVRVLRGGRRGPASRDEVHRHAMRAQLQLIHGGVRDT